MGGPGRPGLKLILCALAVASSTAFAQFTGLATPADGSVVYFTSALRLKGTNQPSHGKLFAADENGVRVVESRNRIDPPFDPFGACLFGDIYAFQAAEISADGQTIAARGSRSSSGSCRVFARATLVRSPAGEREYPGVLRLSANGRYAVIDTTPTAFSAPAIALLDLQTGTRKELSFPSPGSISFAYSGRTITDSGTAILWNGRNLCLVTATGDVQTLPGQFPFPIAISADGRRVLYLDVDLNWTDLRTGEDHVLVREWRSVGGGLSDDGARAAFIQDGQAIVVDWNGGGPGRVTNDPVGISALVLSGNGKVLYAVTATNRLLKVTVDTGEAIELIGRTPEISYTGAVTDAGLFTTVVGAGFSDATASAPYPLPDTLAGVGVWIGDRKAPIARVTPTEIDVQMPADAPPDSTFRLVVDAPAAHSPFDAPESTIRVFNMPRAGAIAHQAWDSLVTAASPPHVGEIIHVWAVGLGPVAPNPGPGAVAPGAEPFARLASPMTCTNAEVLYAGLAPGWVARIYQVDLRLGPITGYQPIDCRTGDLSFRFLTFAILP